MPTEVIAPASHGYSYVSNWQRNIQSLSLITDGSCVYHLKRPLNLPFTHLTTVSWRGIQAPWNLIDLGGVLQANRAKLKHIVIEIMDWKNLLRAMHELSRIRGFDSKSPEHAATALQRDQMPRVFAEHVLGVRSGCSTPLFSCLTSLSLSYISLADETVTRDVSIALNFANLTTLKLIDCSGTANWLQKVVDTKQAVRLKNFELLIESGFVGFEASLLSEFISTFTGLEQLYVKLSCYAYDLSNSGIIDLYRSLLSHSSTLRELVLHYKDIEEEEDEDLDQPADLESETKRSDAMKQLLLCSKLRYLGVSETSAFLVRKASSKPLCY